MSGKDEGLLTVGWREWVSLPKLGIPAVKAKLDTGARTSALHTFRLETFRRRGKLKVRFFIHPLQRRTDVEIACVADVLDKRLVSDSGGHVEMRYVIRTPVVIGGMTIDTELSLTNRNSMRFRMLLGRTAMAGAMVVDPRASYATGRSLGRDYKKSLKGSGG